MARPTKQGIDYFPVDVTFDDKIELFLIEFGSDGLAVMIVIWQLIYSNYGYYIENNQDLLLLIKRRFPIEPDTSIEIINKLIERNIFDQEKEKRYKILTSRAVQKRYFDAAQRKKIVNVYKNYILSGINVSENSTYIEINVSKNSTYIDVDTDVDLNGDVEVNIISKKTSKKEIPLFPDNSQEFNRAFEDFAEMRKNQKKPLTARAKELAFKTLQKLSKYEDVQIQIMEQSTMNCYQGLFPLKQNNNSKPDKNDAFMNMVYNEKTGLLE